MTKSITTRPIRLYSAGARRGATAMAPYVAELARTGTMSVAATYIDPVPGRAAAMAQHVETLGLQVDHEEIGVQEFIRRDMPNNVRSILVLHLDSAAAIAETLSNSVTLPTLVYAIIGFPTNHMAGIHAAIDSRDDQARTLLARFFSKLAEVAARTGSRAIFGAQSPASNRHAEPLYRHAFASHFRANLPKLAAGLAPESTPLEMTFDGRTVEPTVIIRNSGNWMTEAEVLSRLPTLISSPLAPGQSLLIIEIGDAGLRVHRARLRRFDHSVDVTTLTGVDPQLVETVRAAQAALSTSEFERRSDGGRRPTVPEGTQAALSMMGGVLLTD